jgi:dipeptidase
MCDTFCVRRADRMLFAKNSDRPPDEAQVVESRPRRGAGTVETQYLTLPDPGAAAVVASRPTWLRGAEHGVNEHRVAVGNEKIWTVDDPRDDPPALLGMDLVALVLDRAHDADEGLAVLTELLSEHGQGGSGEADRDVPYYSSFLIADPRRAWIVETSGRRFAARPANDGDAISNRVSIGTDWTVASRDVAAGTDIDTWRSPRIPTGIADFRLAATRACASVATTSRELVATLRHHGERPWGAPGTPADDVAPPPPEIGDDFSGITVCMHTRGADTTTASMVCELPVDDTEVVRAWFALGSPCASVFVPAFPPFVAPELARPEEWWRFAALRERVERDAGCLAEVRAELAPVEAALWDEADARAHDTAGSSARAEFAARAFEPVDRALRRLGV